MMLVRRFIESRGEQGRQLVREAELLPGDMH